jgi:T-complex protein 1 subunit beta
MNPIQLFKNNGMQEKGEDASISILMGGIVVADLIKSTLGPKGMDKILQSADKDGDVKVTNDGATILKNLILDNPSSKIMVDISKTQDDEVGDGTTSVVVFAGELLREADRLIHEFKIHPQIIIQGWREASKVALQTLEESAIDHKKDEEAFKRDLMDIARTTLSSKILGHGYKEQFSKMVVDAVLRLKGSTNLDMIHIVKKIGGGIGESRLDPGFILLKKIGVGQPKIIEKAKILVANTSMDTDKIKIFASKVKVTSPEEIVKIEQAERERMLEKCQKIIDHGINCFINRQLIYNLPEQFFTDNGVVAIEHADFEGVERLSLVLDADIVSTFDDPEKVKLGHCDRIEEIMIGEDKAIRFSGVARGEACTIILRGPTKHILDEAERSIHDALCVISQAVANEPKIVYGAGCSEMQMALAVDKLAQSTAGKKAIAIESFARALRQLPAIIADNGGYDSSELIAQLRAAHYNGNKTMGLDMTNGTLGNIEELRILESLKVKRNFVRCASEAAEMILRVDQIFRSAPRKRERDPRYGGHH